MELLEVKLLLKCGDIVGLNTASLRIAESVESLYPDGTAVPSSQRDRKDALSHLPDLPPLGTHSGRKRSCRLPVNYHIECETR